MPYLIYYKVKGSGYDRFYKRKNRKSKSAEKLIKQWRTKQETKNKAELLLSRNPELKESPALKQNAVARNHPNLK